MKNTPSFFKDYFSRIDQAFKTGNSTEHTYRPALKALIEAYHPHVIATNEPQRIKCGAPDFIVTYKNIPQGFIEAKDIGVSLDDAEKSEQLRRYRISLSNLILTDYLEFRWYLDGELRATARFGKKQVSGKLRVEVNGEHELRELLQGFFSTNIPLVTNPKDLAVRMAAMAQLIRSIIGKTFAEEDEHGALHEQMAAFRKVLLHDLTVDQFGDMYAQTICYGLFAARCNCTEERFTRTHAAYDLPKTNPFLRKLFAHIAGPDLDERIVWAVDNLAELLNRANIAAILKDFGRSTRQEDPVVHFYETFLGAYDQKMREARGVYYTPEPVVSYIVRSVDAILKHDFRLHEGLADSSKVKLSRPSKTGKGVETIETHKVQILDPATGTATFLHSVIGQIYKNFETNKGMWPSYVRENLLPRLYGFELLMAPYAVAHMKLGLLLRETGYDFHSDERLRVFLTNTLEEAHELAGLPLFAQWLAEEANSANKVKKESPVMVVLGNPPYSGHSANAGEWIAGLLRGHDSVTRQSTGNYFEVDGEPLGERNPKWLNDDYVKFVRFAQWRIEQTGYGVLAFITNHGYLDNPTFRGMRQSLLQSFDQIFLLDLHGSSKKKEKASDGSKDENVFDIQSGVSIGLFIKKSKKQAKPAKIYHNEIYGTRELKYDFLTKADITTTKWRQIEPQSPFYLFIPQDERLREEYNAGWKITEIMPVNVLGFQTHRDNFAIDFDREMLRSRIAEMRHEELSDAEFARQYDLVDGSSWNLASARSQLRSDKEWKEKIVPCAYRPFDTRWSFYSEIAMDRPRRELKDNVFGKENICLLSSRQQGTLGYRHSWIADSPANDCVVSSRSREANYVFPLYLYTLGEGDLFDDPNTSAGVRLVNLAPKFIADLTQKLHLTYVPGGCGDLKKTFGPEDVLHYTYAVLHSPTYRSRYAEFLKIDFPRLPLTSDVALFRCLCLLGSELVSLHLMKQLPALETRYPIAGDSTVEFVKYTEPEEQIPGRVWINDTQYFENVTSEVWGYHVGGYQVCQKWLKDRKSRKLSYDDLTHYRGIVAALSRTIKLQDLIDEEIGEWPLS